jgi:hypothetical protein
LAVHDEFEGERYHVRDCDLLRLFPQDRDGEHGPHLGAGPCPRRGIGHSQGPGGDHHRGYRRLEVIAVTHSTGFGKPDTQELTPRNREAIEAAGGTILTCQHPFGGVGRAVRKRLGTYQVEEIIAFALRTFGQGIKVVAEIALMAADAGLVRTDEPVIAVAGTGRGADTAVILKPTNAQTFFDLRFLEIICMPSPEHP